MAHSVFIDGQAGTTGLEIAARLARRGDLAVLRIEDQWRKDDSRRRELMRQADVVVLCLPDDAARQAVELAPDGRFLDASTAHRVAADWVYGLPELEAEQRQRIRDARRVSNPGCYPTGFILAVRPLIESGMLLPTTPLKVNAVSGYSGGGKSLIAKYRACDSEAMRVRPYGLALRHKHVPEMHRHSLTDLAPVFVPTVGHFHQGMLVQVPLSVRELCGGDAARVREVLSERYADEAFVHVREYPVPEEALDAGFLSATERNGSNDLDLMVFGHDDQVLLVARYDNLGKGASGAAVQNLNLMLGLPEATGVHLSREPALEAS
ncbi:MAG: N-acetyl-gamma-glutamyl-phosphate reductase [Gammaproteobacteria bacterium]|nr:N-acetyl-gamma-glutamyl-phosphate reductase [Gammaproteobacteria bacterium]MYB38298.1 N-acetyl-gamma-glutamyl-phosphate reductase [Gammaproteobacteria bacterium]